MYVNYVMFGCTKGLLSNQSSKNNLHFNGNPMKLEQDVFVNVSSGLTSRAKVFCNEIVNSAAQKMRKIFGANELPVSKEAQICPVLQDAEGLVADALQGNRVAQNNLDIIQRYNLEIPTNGAVADNGYLRPYHQDAIMEQLNEKGLSSWEMQDVKDNLIFGSGNPVTDGIPDMNVTGLTDATGDGGLVDTIVDIGTTILGALFGF